MVAGADGQILSAVDGQVPSAMDGPIPYLVDGLMVLLPIGKILITRTAKHILDIIITSDRWYFLFLFFFSLING